MNYTKKILALLLAVAMTLSLATMLVGCNSEQGDSTTGGTTPSGDGPAGSKSYMVNVQTIGGMALPELDVYLYADNTLSDLVQFGRTDDKGTVSFTLPEKDGYAVVLANVPKGYIVADTYGFTGTTAAIRLNSSLIANESLAGASLKVGDVMYDFTVTTSDGDEFTLSEVLKEKDMVMLNFWYTTCQYCVEEFPYMQQAYELYKDDIEIIALNGYPLDNPDVVANFKQNNNLTFPMAYCNNAWVPSIFGSSGYPTSVVVDRYGVICLIEIGGMTGLRPFTSIFDHFTGDDYRQKLCSSVNDLMTAVKPTYTMDSSENIGALINSGDINVTYRAEDDKDDAEYAWPFIATEKDGVACLKASNQQIDDSFAIIYADVELKAGQAVGFDYWASSEHLTDILYVIVNGEDIYNISGDTQTGWNACYPWVALEDGTYELALCYLKDESGSIADDTVYIRNMRVVEAKDIEVASYIPRYAATTKDDGFTYDYVTIVFNETDGYYHVGTADGPLLLADLMGYTQFNEEFSIFNLVYDNNMLVDGNPYYDTMLPHFQLASNSALNGVCTVTKELAEQLKEVSSQYGFDGDENEWLKICSYYQVYGSGDAQMQNPILGLSPSSAYTATLGKDVETNYFFYDRPIIPRGTLAKFVPGKTGVYRFTSKSDYAQGIEGWIHDENGELIYTYEFNERMFGDSKNVSMVYFMEKGKTYFINMAFWDVYATGYIYYDAEYLGETYDLFRLASPGYFTFDTDETGEELYYTISGGIDVVLGADGYYYHDLGNGKVGSMLYADFYGVTLFDTPIATNNGVKGMIEKGAFDFSKSENDTFILTHLKLNNNDVDATLESLKKLWGADYEENYVLYEVEDILEGCYHGAGEDWTDEITAYLDDVITSGNEELIGCVPVTEELAVILQALMEKYTFAGVECSWPKLCYYYDMMGR